MAYQIIRIAKLTAENIRNEGLVSAMISTVIASLEAARIIQSAMDDARVLLARVTTQERDAKARLAKARAEINSSATQPRIGLALRQALAYAAMDWIEDTLGIEPDIQVKVLTSVVVIVLVMVLRWLIIRYVASKVVDEAASDAVYRVRKVATYIAFFIIAITLSFVWIDAFDNFATYLGLLSAGIAIALADVLKNIAGWAYLLTRRPMSVGDRVEVGGTHGDVIDIRLFRFTLMEVGNWVDADQSTGRLVHVPNGLLFTQQLANYTEGFSHIWEDLPVLITFESDYNKAEEILRRILAENCPDVEATAGKTIRETARRYRIRVGALTPTVYLSVKDSGVLLTARYLTESRSRRGTAQEIWRAILDSFGAEPSVELAYPTYRIFRPED
jgi:small-conductance mechanosensitive channel